MIQGIGRRNIRSNLKELVISSDSLEGFEKLVIEEKYGLPTLSSLYPDHNYRLEEIIWKGVEPREVFPKLRDISIEVCGLTQVTWIVNLPCLERLHLASCKFMKQVVFW